MLAPCSREFVFDSINSTHALVRGKCHRLSVLAPIHHAARRLAPACALADAFAKRLCGARLVRRQQNARAAEWCQPPNPKKTLRLQKSKARNRGNDLFAWRRLPLGPGWGGVKFAEGGAPANRPTAAYYRHHSKQGISLSLRICLLQMAWLYAQAGDETWQTKLRLRSTNSLQAWPKNTN
jgi:hypothetical protein